MNRKDTGESPPSQPIAKTILCVCQPENRKSGGDHPRGIGSLWLNGFICSNYVIFYMMSHFFKNILGELSKAEKLHMNAKWPFFVIFASNFCMIY